MVVDKHVNILAELLNRVPAEVTLLDINGQSEMVVRLKDLKKLFEETLKLTNKALSPSEMNLCRSISDTNDITFRHELATLTASARGFFEIKEPKKFFDWLHQNYVPDDDLGVYDERPTVLDEFVRLSSSKKARAEFCTEILEKGGNVPPGIKEHIIATVKVRRKKNG
jgi:hypothetical protein